MDTQVREVKHLQSVEVIAHRHSRRLRVLRGIVHSPTGLAGAIMLAIFIVVAILSPLITPYGPIDTDFAVRLSSPSLHHPFGTDDLGRDVLSRLMAGSRISLRAGLIAVVIASTSGTLMGILSGFYRGLIDSIIMRFVDIAMAMPGILLSMVVIFTLGPTLTNVMVAVGIASAPFYARVARGSVLSARENQYVDAARVLGARDTTIMFRHILPNIIGPILVIATLGLGSSILSIASLSFLGLGAQPPTPEWGAIVSDGRSRLNTAWWISTFGGVTIMFAVLAINLLGDAVRDVLDPRIQNR